MTDEVITKPEGTTGEPAPATTPVSPPANAITPPKDNPDTDWKKAYKGLQRNYDKIVADSANLQTENDTLNAQVQEQKQANRALTTEKDQITTKNVEATETISGLEAQVNTSKAQSERSNLIMGEFIDLAKFEAKGLLPEAQTTEDMRAKFTSFREALGTTAQELTDEKLKGIGTGSVDPLTPEPLNEDQLYSQMMALAGSKDPEQRREYDALNRKWMELQEAKE